MSICISVLREKESSNTGMDFLKSGSDWDGALTAPFRWDIRSLFSLQAALLILLPGPTRYLWIELKTCFFHKRSNSKKPKGAKTAHVIIHFKKIWCGKDLTPQTHTGTLYAFRKSKSQASFSEMLTSGSCFKSDRAYILHNSKPNATFQNV